MKLNPYLVFDGDCEAAMTFYAEVFGGRILTSQRFGDLPDTSWVPEGMHDRMMHMRLEFAGEVLMASDHGGQSPYQGHHGMSLSVQADTLERGKALFERLADGGKVEMEFQQTFWAPGFGMCRDRFDVPWMVNVEGDAPASA